MIKQKIRELIHVHGPTLGAVLLVVALPGLILLFLVAVPFYPLGKFLEWITKE